MERIQVIVQVVGVLTLKVVSGSMPLEYHFTDKSMSWADAQRFCRVKYSDLSTVRHMQDHGRMYELLELSGVLSSWIGLRRTETRRWKWADGSGSLQPEYVAWKAGEPNNVGGSEWCAVMSTDGTWADLSCTDPNSYICYELNGQNQVRFIHHNTLTDWRRAQDMCRRNYRDLVTVESSETTSVIKSLVPAGHQAWIGLFNDAWEWSDGNDSSYRAWAEGTEDEGSCAALRFDGSMTSANCEEVKPFFCEGGLKTQKTLVKITVSTTADLHSSIFNFKVLQHVHKQLKTNQVSDFKLRWRKEARKVFRQQQAPGTIKNDRKCKKV